MHFSDQGTSLSRDLRAFLAERVEPHVAEWEVQGGYPAREVMQSLASSVPALNEAIRSGGTARLEAARVLEHALAPSMALGIAASLSIQLNVVAPVLVAFGSAALRRAYLSPVLNGELLVSWSMPDQANERSLPTAALENGRLVVTGRATHVINAVGADLHAQVVRIRRPGIGTQPGLLLIPAEAQGIEVIAQRQIGYRSAPVCTVRYHGTAVSIDMLVGEHNTGAALADRQRRLFWALSALRLAATATEMLARCKTWCEQRKIFGAPLLNNQAVQFRLAEGVANAALTLQLARVAVEAQAWPEGPGLLAEQAKYTANQLVADVAEMTTHLHGAHGYIDSSYLSRFYRDAALAMKCIGANDTVLRRVFDSEMNKNQNRHD